MAYLLILACLVIGLMIFEWPRVFVYHILLRAPDFRGWSHPVEPPPSEPQGGWREILGVPSGERRMALVKKAYMKKARMLHPDKGGSTAAMARLNEAYRMAKEELGGG